MATRLPPEFFLEQITDFFGECSLSPFFDAGIFGWVEAIRTLPPTPERFACRYALMENGWDNR